MILTFEFSLWCE